MASSVPVALPAAPPHVLNFLGLPAEIRNIIYDHLLLVPQPMTIGARGCNSARLLPGQHTEFVKPSTSILSCSRTIRAEAMPMLYGNNTLQIFVHNGIQLYRASPYTDTGKLNMIKHLVVNSQRLYTHNTMNKTRAREIKRMAGLERLTIVRQNNNTSTTSAFLRVNDGLHVRNSMKGGLMIILRERPAVSCRLILEHRTRPALNSVSHTPALFILSPRMYQLRGLSLMLFTDYKLPSGPGNL